MNSRIRLKTDDDIKRIRESGAIIEEIFFLLQNISFTGTSTAEIDSFIESRIRKRKARSAFETVPGYSHSSCISINDEALHGIPSKKKIIRDGDIIKIDIGVALNGYFSDACHTFCADGCRDEKKRLVAAAHEARSRGIASMVPGNRLGDIGAAIQDYAESTGFSVVKKYSGHGVGFLLHEAPPVPHFGAANTGIIIEEGMVLAVEPILNEGSGEVRLLKNGWTAVTADGKLSAQFEHTVAVTHMGPVTLTGGHSPITD